MDNQGRIFGISGGLITSDSFLSSEERKSVVEISLRAASAGWREAAKEGMLSLYADPIDVLEKYKDTPVVQAMNDRKNANILWVRARAIDADVVNANGDYFSEEELLKENDIQGVKMAAYKTFEGCPIYANHKNNDITEAKGMIVYSEWNDDEKAVYTVFFVDADAYPDIARGIRIGYQHDVSMGCSVQHGVCSECGNKAAHEAEYCQHLKNHKGKNLPGTSRKVYEKNYGIKFIELSVVGDGAFERCIIKEIYDTDEILQKALTVEKKAESLNSSIMLAAAMAPSDRKSRFEYENQLRLISNLARSAMSIAVNPRTVTAQTAGTLVGGQLMATDGANQNTTVAGIIQYLGIDAKSGLNILDMLNLALNFLEVAVMNLFARKDNVDLTHVGKITKAMADLQSTMQDMIDDGVDSSGGGGQNTPLNQGQIQQQPGVPGQQQMPQPGQQPGQQQAIPEFMPLHGGVGRSVSQMSGAQPPAMPGFFGASNDAEIRTANKLFVRWAGDDDSEEPGRLVTASTQKNVERNISKFERLGASVMELGNVLGVNDKATRVSQSDHTNTRVSFDDAATSGEVYKEKASQKAIGVSGKMNEFLERIAGRMRKTQAPKASFDITLEDESRGTKVVLSSANGINGYQNNQRVAWFNPRLSEAQIDGMKNDVGAAELAKDLLDQLGNQIEAANRSGRDATAGWEPDNDHSTTYENRLESKRTNNPEDIGEVREKTLAEGGPAGDYSRKGPDNRVQEKQLEGDYFSKRRDSVNKVQENLIGEDSGLYKRRLDPDDLGTVKEKLLTDARHGNPKEVIELQLDDVRKDYGPGEPNLVVEATVNALGNAVVVAQVTPEEIVSAVKEIVKANAEELIAIAALGSKSRIVESKRYEFHNKAAQLPVNSAIFNELGKIVGRNASTTDVASALEALASESVNAIKTITASAKILLGENSIPMGYDAETVITPKDRMRASLAAIASKNEENIIVKDNLGAALRSLTTATLETKSHPREVVSAIVDADSNTLFTQVELARSAESVAARKIARDRKNFHGTRSASAKDVYTSMVGMLADFADASSLSTASIVKAAKRLSEQPDVTEELITRTIENPRKSTAATVTEDKTQKREIHCTLDELGGLDPKSDDFDSGLRSKTMDILTSAGYQVDPSSFALSNVTVNDNSVTASIETHITKTFQVSGAPTDMSMADSVDTGGTIGGDVPSGEASNDPNVMDDGTTISTAGARRLIRAKRNAILNRYAQGMPGMGGGGMGAPGGQGLDAGGGAGAADGLGMSALTVPTDAGGNPEDEPTDTDAMTEPGEKQPFGTVCPNCGSKDVDVANGEGKCKDCEAVLEYELTVHIKPSRDSDKKDDSETPDFGAGAPPLGPDTGLGAATAPAPMPGGGTPPPGGAGAPPIMATIKWLQDSESFVRLANTKGNRSSLKELPVGCVCPGCGNRNATKVQNNTFCYACGTYAMSGPVKVAKDKSGKLIPGKVEVSITTVI